MKRFLIYLFLTTIQLNVVGQNNETYEGGIEKYFETIGKNLKYPRNDRNEGIEGALILKFKTDGKTIDSIEVLNSVSTNIDMEAIRVFNLTSGKWRLTPNEFYLAKIIFRLDFPGKITTESIKKERDKESNINAKESNITGTESKYHRREIKKHRCGIEYHHRKNKTAVPGE